MVRHIDAIKNPVDRHSFIGGSDARIVMGDDAPALLRLWREKRGEVEPEDLSSDLLVQLGKATEQLNRYWYEKNTGQNGGRRAAARRATRCTVGWRQRSTGG
jgi:predicted phage-related endonuclease